MTVSAPCLDSTSKRYLIKLTRFQYLSVTQALSKLLHLQVSNQDITALNIAFFVHAPLPDKKSIFSIDSDFEDVKWWLELGVLVREKVGSRKIYCESQNEIWQTLGPCWNRSPSILESLMGREDIGRHGRSITAWAGLIVDFPFINLPVTWKLGPFDKDDEYIRTLPLE